MDVVRNIMQMLSIGGKSPLKKAVDGVLHWKTFNILKSAKTPHEMLLDVKRALVLMIDAEPENMHLEILHSVVDISVVCTADAALALSLFHSWIMTNYELDPYDEYYTEKMIARGHLQELVYVFPEAKKALSVFPIPEDIRDTCAYRKKVACWIAEHKSSLPARLGLLISSTGRRHLKNKISWQEEVLYNMIFSDRDCLEDCVWSVVESEDLVLGRPSEECADDAVSYVQMKILMRDMCAAIERMRSLDDWLYTLFSLVFADEIGTAKRDSVLEDYCARMKEIDWEIAVCYTVFHSRKEQFFAETVSRIGVKTLIMFMMFQEFAESNGFSDRFLVELFFANIREKKEYFSMLELSTRFGWKLPDTVPHAERCEIVAHFVGRLDEFSEYAKSPQLREFDAEIVDFVLAFRTLVEKAPLSSAQVRVLLESPYAAPRLRNILSGMAACPLDISQIVSCINKAHKMNELESLESFARLLLARTAETACPRNRESARVS